MGRCIAAAIHHVPMAMDVHIPNVSMISRKVILLVRARAVATRWNFSNGKRERLKNFLRRSGDKIISIPETAIGGAQAILMHESGVLEGASDPRKDGCALGY